MISSVRVGCEAPDTPGSDQRNGITPEFVRWLSSRDAPVFLRNVTAESLEAAAKWLGEPANYKWLDFGGGRQVLTPAALHYMTRSGSHCIRTCHDETDRLVGIVGLQHVDSKFKSAMLWGVRPRLRPPTRSNAVHQIRQIIKVGFTEYGLASIYAWVVAINAPSIVAVKAAGMTEMGRQRSAHVIDGVSYDRVLLDILPEEFDAQERAILRLRDERMSSSNAVGDDRKVMA